MILVVISVHAVAANQEKVVDAIDPFFELIKMLSWIFYLRKLIGMKRLTRERFNRDFSDFFQTYSNFLPIVGVLIPHQAFFLLTLLCGDRAQNVVFGVKIRVQRNGHNFLWLKAFSIIFSTSVRG